MPRNKIKDNIIITIQRLTENDTKQRVEHGEGAAAIELCDLYISSPLIVFIFR